MKKILLIVIILFSLVGCGGKTAKSAAESYLMKYRNLDSEVLVDLENIIETENLTRNQEEKYRDILKKQYSDLKYEIIDETYDGDTAVVKAKVEVYDLYKAQSDSADYLNDHMDEFKDESGAFNNSSYLDYKLENMKKTTETVEYTIEFNVVKNENNNWKVIDLTQEDLEKIHGIYNYNGE